MGFENVKLWYAKDEENKIVTIDKVLKNKKYYCPICSGELIPKLGEKVTNHFAHIDKSKCAESYIHFWLKNKLLNIGDKFKIKFDENEIKEYTCKDIKLEVTYKTDFGDYRPDITVYTEEGQTIFIEIAYTNFKVIEEYFDRWSYLNEMVVQVSSNEIINWKDLDGFKCIYFENEIYNFTKLSTNKNHNRKNRREEDIIYDMFELEIAKEELDKINWFWSDCLKLKLGKITEEDFFNTIDYLDINLRQFVIDKILKTNCTQLRWFYLDSKQKHIKDKIISFIDKNKEYSFISRINAITSKETIRRDRFNKSFMIPKVSVKLENGYIIKEFYTDYFDEYMLDDLLNNIEYSCKNIKNDFEKVNNTLYENGLKGYNITYNIESDFSKTKIILKYYKNELENFYVDNIYNYDLLKEITHKIYKHKKDIRLTGLENDIKTLLEFKNKNIEKLNKIKNNYSLSLYCNYFREDEIIVYLRLSNENEYKDNYMFIIKGNEIRDINGVYKFSTIDNFNKIISRLIQIKIREIRYK